MKWGWIKTGARVAAHVVAERESARLKAENDALRQDRDYWRAKAEALLDQIAMKAGQAPVMSSAARTDSTAHTPFRGLTVTEIPQKEPTK